MWEKSFSRRPATAVELVVLSEQKQPISDRLRQVEEAEAGERKVDPNPVWFLKPFGTAAFDFSFSLVWPSEPGQRLCLGC